MSQLSPITVFRQVSDAVPLSCRINIVIIGSLAAAYAFFRDDPSRAVRTKDVDCVLEPFSAAVSAGQNIVRELLDSGWQRRLAGDHQQPGDQDTPVDALPAVRLYPPGVDPASEEAWFLEFLTVPESVEASGKTWTRLPLDEGHFGLPAFRFLSIAAFGPEEMEGLGIRYARPHMMALANLLEHPRIGPEPMSSQIGGRTLKRSNKDPGRVLAIATLADLDDYRPWATDWKTALEATFPDQWRELTLQAGDGLRQLLASPDELNKAHHSCVNGLLAFQPPTLDALRGAGAHVIGDAVEALEAFGKG